MNTIDTITGEIKQAGKDISKPTVYRYMEKLGVKPLGARQRPQHYPPDTAQRILVHLGLVTERGPEKILTVKEAKREAARGRK